MRNVRSDEALRTQLEAITDERKDEDERRYIDRLLGAKAALQWVLGDGAAAPVSLRVSDDRPGWAGLSAEDHWAEDVVRGARPLPPGLSRDFVLGAIEALCWAAGTSESTPASMPIG